jgi:pyruvate/2-oxoglutarate/acetoin dehydrogenase E1 component/TPP-dependent pyruvate/acetoin dehydrogenase alpha subunit
MSISASLATTESQYEALFRQALLIRRVEERIIALYPDDKIQSPVHLSIGQEAVAVGVCAALDPSDWLFCSYRSHAFYIAKNGDLKQMFAELYGKTTGVAAGKAGSMHLTAPEVGLMGASAVVASTLPHAIGAAYAAKLRGEKRLHVAVYGDGATEEGVYHECLNFVALHRLPVLLVCENNGYAAHSALAARQSYTIGGLAAAYGIPVHKVDEGYDFMLIRDRIAPLVAALRAGAGPQFIEITTHRYKEHVGINDDFEAGYRSVAPVRAWQKNDPLITDTATAARLLPAIEADIDRAVDFAEQSPWPDRAALTADMDDPGDYAPQAAPTPAPQAGTAAGTMSYREALRQVMHGAMRANPNTIILGQGVDDHKGTFGSTLNLHKEFGAARVFDTPLAEEGMAGISLGAALGGLYPIQTHIRSDFMILATNQIINLIAKYRYMFGGRFEVPMLIRAVVGRSWGQGAQHSQSLQSLFAHIPGLTVIMPANAQSIMETYPFVTAHYRGPVISLEHRLLYDLNFEIDAAAVTAPKMPLTSRKVRVGKDVTIVATSIMVLEAQRAARYLFESAGIDCEIIDLHCVSHPNADMIFDSVRKTGKLVVADTSWLAYGVAAEVSRLITARDPSVLKAPITSLGMAPVPCPTAKTLEDMYYPNLAELVDATAKLVTGRSDHGVVLPDERSMAEVYKKFRGPF